MSKQSTQGRRGWPNSVHGPLCAVSLRRVMNLHTETRGWPEHEVGFQKWQPIVCPSFGSLLSGYGHSEPGMTLAAACPLLACEDSVRAETIQAFPSLCPHSCSKRHGWHPAMAVCVSTLSLLPPKNDYKPQQSGVQVARLGSCVMSTQQLRAESPSTPCCPGICKQTLWYAVSYVGWDSGSQPS